MRARVRVREVLFGSVAGLLVIATMGCQAGSGRNWQHENTAMSTFFVEPSQVQCTFVDAKGKSKSRIVEDGGMIWFGDLDPPVTVTCTQEGYYPYARSLQVFTAFQQAVLGSVFGGGPTNPSSWQYSDIFPRQVHIRLEPKRFETVEAREKWYEVRRVEIEQERRATWQQVRGACTQNEDCASRDSAFEKHLAAELKAMDERRVAAEIAAD